MTVNRSNLTGDISISCTVQAVESYGTVQVDDTLMARRSPAVSDANDEFGIVNGDLKVDTNKAEGSYILDNGQVRITGVTLGGDLTANAMVFTSWPNKAVEFKYNADGLRTQKKVTVGDMAWTTDYILHGKLVTEMRRGNDVLHFYYDTHNQPSICECNGQKMIYVHNLQGDIVAIVDSDGAKVVEYNYDAWGRDIGRTLTSDIGELNPFRYRGYVYDAEIGLYYLRARYYNSLISRFISADDCCETAINGINGFAYCHNSPEISEDHEGNLPTLFSLYKECHRQVQLDMRQRDANIEIEVTAINLSEVWWRKSNYGYVDAFNTVTHEIWEIKKSTVPFPIAQMQLDRYLNGELRDYPNVKPIPGGYVSGHTQYGEYTIRYYSVAPGIIVYDIDDSSYNPYPALSLLGGIAWSLYQIMNENYRKELSRARWAQVRKVFSSVSKTSAKIAVGVGVVITIIEKAVDIIGSILVFA